MILQSKYIEDENGVKYAPISTPNAVRWPDGSNLNDKLGSISYNDLEDKPTNVSDFNNDAGYLNQHQDISGKADKNEMSVTDGTGADSDKTTIQLKSGTSATVLKSHQSLAGKQDVIDAQHKLSADLVDDSTTTNKFTNATEKQTWNNKQDTLVSGTNIKTINNESILGNGNITIQGGGVQSDWEQSDSTANDFIKNKPTIPNDYLVDHSKQYLTFIAKENGTFTFTPQNNNVISYSTDGGNTWTVGNSVQVSSGDKVMWKGEMTPETESSPWGIGRFSASTNSFDVQGNIMSLLYGDNFKNQISLSGKTFAFDNLFYNTKVINAENLSLSATTLADFCYRNMFYNCTNLTVAPELPATTLANSCYLGMFRGCTNLTTASELPATTLVENCYEYMFEDCISLTTAPVLPATTLAEYCYDSMFNGCSNLSSIICLATDISAEDCTYDWVSGVAANGIFVKAASMSSWTIDDSGIPTGWNAYTEDEYEVARHYEIDKMTVVTKSSGTTLTAAIGNYYRFTYNVGTLAITLPTPTGSNAQSILFFMTTGASPAVTFTSTGNTIYKNDGFAIDATTTYEINALWNGGAWVINAVKYTV